MKRKNPMLFAAGVGAAAMIAAQVAGKATRDALFLSYFPVSSLPVMAIIASLLSIAAGFLTARLMTKIAPSLLVPPLFLLSSGLHFVEWWIIGWNPSSAAILIYLQIAILGSALISGFWSMLDDRFDARSARKQFGRIVAASTFGGLVGGIVAERVGSVTHVANILPILAIFHLLCAIVLRALAPGCRGSKRVADRQTREAESGFAVLRRAPYVRNLALLILMSTLGAGLLDFVFKARTAAVYTQGAELVRFFALFYTATGVVTFLVQSLLSRIAIERLGIAGTVSSLPLTLAFGSIGSLFFPGLSTVFGARAGESVFRSSLFKSGYEMLYSAAPRRERHATKTILDVGVDRFGDLLSALLLGAIVLIAPGNSAGVILALAAVLGLAGFGISRRLQRGYVQALESNLLSQTTSGRIPSPRVSDESILQRLPYLAEGQTPLPIPASSVQDSVLRHIQDLRSPNPEVVRRRLGRSSEIELVPHIIRLLAWDAVSADAVEALKKIGPKVTGQLVDALLDADQAFAVRRRIPRVLVEFDSQRTVDGLIEALSDSSFEVRFRSGQALAQIQNRNRRLLIDNELIIQAVDRELEVREDIWREHQVIDSPRREQDSPITIEHVFRLLELVLPREPLQIAQYAIGSRNDHLKATSLEYLENVLPARLRRRIVPLFEDNALAAALTK